MTSLASALTADLTREAQQRVQETLTQLGGDGPLGGVTVRNDGGHYGGKEPLPGQWKHLESHV